MTRVTTHPGRMLYLEFMEPLGLSSRALAERMGVPANRISELVAGRRTMTADTAIRLERLFGMPADFWLRVQAGHDATKARAENDYSSITPLDLSRLAG
jgi:antitoxin HigA-1